MTISYELSSGLPVRDCPELHEAVKELQQAFQDGGYQYQVEAFKHPEGQMNVHINGVDFTTYMGAGDLDDEIKEKLGPFVTEPAWVYYECDGESGKFYIGPADREEEAEMESALEECRTAWSQLTPEGQKLFLAEITKQENQNAASNQSTN